MSEVQIDIGRINTVAELCLSIEATIERVETKDEYDRLRSYIDARFNFRLPYELDKFKNPKIK